MSSTRRSLKNKDWDEQRHRKLVDWQIDLIEAVCRSGVLNKIEGGEEILRYLAVYSEQADKPHRATKIINDRIFSGQKKNVADRAASIQRQLTEYFDHAGSHHEKRIVINLSQSGGPRNPNQYALDYKFNTGEGTSTRKFWVGYLPRNIPTLITHGVPLFETNEEHDMFSRLTSRNFEKEIGSDMLACYPYVTIGEMMATVDLSTWLTQRGVRVVHHGFRSEHGAGDILESGMGGMEDSNGIFLGVPAVNGVLRHYQRHSTFPFMFGQDGQIIETLEGGETKTYANRIKIKGEHFIAHVLVSRREGKRNQTVTLIASSTGRTIQRMAQLFTRDRELRDLFAKEPFTLWDGLPKEFQLLFEVDVVDRERVAAAYRLIRWWRA